MGRRSFANATQKSTSVKTPAPPPAPRSFADATKTAAPNIMTTQTTMPQHAAVAANTSSSSSRQQQQPQQQPQPRRISASQKHLLEYATAKFAQSKLLQATPAEHRATVDDTLGTYITTQLMDQQWQNNNNNNNANGDDDKWEALVELIHDHCHVEWSVAKSIIDVIFERIHASTAMATEGNSLLLPNDLLDEASGGPKRGGPTILRSASPDPLHFPPLGATTSTQKASSGQISKTRGKATATARSSKTPEHSIEAAEVAAALFPPTTTRSRQSSMDDTSRRSSSIDETLPTQQLPMAPPQHTLQPAYYYPPSMYNPYYQQQQQHQDYVYNTSELLLSMNAELSHEAAYMASQIAHADVNLAQYIVETTANDVPICRDYLLNDTCYRSDCPWSHVPPEQHTCVFWLKSFCSKGAGCRFLHSFSNRLIQSLPQLSSQQQYANPALPLHPAAAATANFEPRVPDESSFANIAQQNYGKPQFVEPRPKPKTSTLPANKIRSIPIPAEVWNVSENRDATVFGIDDPLERYARVQRQNPRDNVMDLHFQSLKTFPIVLETLLDGLLEQHGGVWIVTGTGHHVGHRTHQKSGGALEAAVINYLMEHGYDFQRGRDKSGQSGALFVDGYNKVT